MQKTTPVRPAAQLKASSGPMFAHKVVATPPVYRPAAATQRPQVPPVYGAAVPAVQAKRVAAAVPRPTAAPRTYPPAYRPGRSLQMYEVKTKDRKKIIELRNRFVTANGSDSYYEEVFDKYVAQSSVKSMEDVEAYVAALEAKVQAAALAVRQLPQPAPTVQKPVVVIPVKTEEEKRLKREAKQQKEAERLARQVDLSGPVKPLPLVGSFVAVTTAAVNLPGPIVNPLPQAPTTVENLVSAARKWDGKSDKGTHVTLSETEVWDLLTGLEGIKTKSGKNSRYFVCYSEGEAKYNYHVCVKAIAAYSQAVAQVTVHKPTYHYEVQNLNTLPVKFAGYLVA